MKTLLLALLLPLPSLAGDITCQTTGCGGPITLTFQVEGIEPGASVNIHSEGMFSLDYPTRIVASESLPIGVRLKLVGLNQDGALDPLAGEATLELAPQDESSREIASGRLHLERAPAKPQGPIRFSKQYELRDCRGSL
jgi:hypothetical protein